MKNTLKITLTCWGLILVTLPTYCLKYTQAAVKLNQTTTINNATNINKYGYSSKAAVGFTQPGLSKGQNVVIQGIDYSEDLKWMFLCGYVDPTESVTTGNTNSVIFILDMAQNDPVTGNPGKFIKEIILQKIAGTAYTGHAGGIAVTKKNIFISNGGNLLRLSLNKVIGSGTTVTAKFDEYIPVPVNASYCSFDDDYNVIWVGEFEYADGDYTTDASHHNGNYTSWTVGYKIDETGASGYNANNGFKTASLGGTSGATPDYILWHCNKIQGMAAVANKIMLSQSYGRANTSYIHTYDNKVYGPSAASKTGTVTLNNTNIPYWTLSEPSKLSAAPMTEDLATFRSGNTYYMYIASEAASYKFNGASSSIATDPVYSTVKYKVASVTPVINLDKTSLSMSALINEVATTTIKVTGNYLTDNISISSNNASVISVSPATLDKNGGTITVTFRPVATEGNSATLTFTSGSISNTATVTGTIAAAVSVNVNANGGTYGNNTSFEVGDGKMVELSTISRTGYDFIGWGGTGAKYITGYQAYSSTATDNCSSKAFECSTPETVTFNGTDKAVALGTDYKFTGTNYYTASIWAYMSNWGDYNTDTEGTASNAMRIFSCSQSGGWNIQSITGCYIALHCNHTNKSGSCIATNIRLNGETSSNTYEDSDKTIVTTVGQSASTKKWSNLASGWHMFTFTYSGNIVRLFIDGVLMGKTTAFGNSVNSGTLREIYYHATNGIFIGAEAGANTSTPTGNYFKGKMKNACFLNTYIAGSDNTANDGDQIQRIYNSQKANDGKTFLRVRKLNDATLTLKALWKAHTYTIAYNANGGNGTMNSTVHTYDVAKNLTANSFTKTSCEFAGWNTTANGTGTAYNDKANVVNLSAKDSDTITLYAQWNRTTEVSQQQFDQIKVIHANNAIQITGLQSNTHCSIYDISGKLLLKKVATDNSTTIDNLPQGVYVLKTDSETLKIVL
jgi:hypothetical protein